MLESVPAGPVGVEQTRRLGEADRVVEPARGFGAHHRALGERPDQAESARDAVADRNGENPELDAAEGYRQNNCK